MSAYPSVLDTLESLLVARDNLVLRTRNNTGAADVDIALLPSPLIATLQATDGVLSVGNEILTYAFIDDAAGSFPTLRNCVRGAFGTTAQDYAPNTRVELRTIADHHNRLAAAVVAIEDALGVDIDDGHASLAERLARHLTVSIPISPASTDWSFQHDRRRVVSIQLWEEVAPDTYEQFSNPVSQFVDVGGLSTVTITLVAPKAGFIVVT